LLLMPQQFPFLVQDGETNIGIPWKDLPQSLDHGCGMVR
jgi:hypothetical protein